MGKAYKVVVYDRGYVTMCEMVDGEWRDCTFSTRDEARKALDDYWHMWHRGGHIVEVNA